MSVDKNCDQDGNDSGNLGVGPGVPNPNKEDVLKPENNIPERVSSKDSPDYIGPVEKSSKQKRSLGSFTKRIEKNVDDIYLAESSFAKKEPELESPIEKSSKDDAEPEMVTSRNEKTAKQFFNPAQMEEKISVNVDSPDNRDKKDSNRVNIRPDTPKKTLGQFSTPPPVAKTDQVVEMRDFNPVKDSQEFVDPGSEQKEDTSLVIDNPTSIKLPDGVVITYNRQIKQDTLIVGNSRKGKKDISIGDVNRRASKENPNVAVDEDNRFIKSNEHVGKEAVEESAKIGNENSINANVALESPKVFEQIYNELVGTEKTEEDTGPDEDHPEKTEEAIPDSLSTEKTETTIPNTTATEKEEEIIPNTISVSKGEKEIPDSESLEKNRVEIDEIIAAGGKPGAHEIDTPATSSIGEVNISIGDSEGLVRTNLLYDPITPISAQVVENDYNTQVTQRNKDIADDNESPWGGINVNFAEGDARIQSSIDGTLSVSRSTKFANDGKNSESFAQLPVSTDGGISEILLNTELGVYSNVLNREEPHGVIVTNFNYDTFASSRTINNSIETNINDIGIKQKVNTSFSVIGKKEDEAIPYFESLINASYTDGQNDNIVNDRIDRKQDALAGSEDFGKVVLSNYESTPQDVDAQGDGPQFSFSSNFESNIRLDRKYDATGESVSKIVLNNYRKTSSGYDPTSLTYDNISLEQDVADDSVLSREYAQNYDNSERPGWPDGKDDQTVNATGVINSSEARNDQDDDLVLYSNLESNVDNIVSRTKDTSASLTSSQKPGNKSNSTDQDGNDIIVGNIPQALDDEASKNISYNITTNIAEAKLDATRVDAEGNVANIDMINYDSGLAIYNEDDSDNITNRSAIVTVKNDTIRPIGQEHVNFIYDITSHGSRTVPTEIITAPDDVDTGADESISRMSIGVEGLKSAVSSSLVNAADNTYFIMSNSGTPGDTSDDIRVYEGTAQSIYNDSGQEIGFVYANQENTRFDYSGINSSASEIKLNSLDVNTTSGVVGTIGSAAWFNYQDPHSVAPSAFEAPAANTAAWYSVVRSQQTGAFIPAREQLSKFNPEYFKTYGSTTIDNLKSVDGSGNRMSLANNLEVKLDGTQTTPAIINYNNYDSGLAVYNATADDGITDRDIVINNLSTGRPIGQEHQNINYTNTMALFNAATTAPDPALKNNAGYANDYRTYDNWPGLISGHDWVTGSDLTSLYLQISPDADTSFEIDSAWAPDRYGSPSYAIPRIRSSVDPSPDVSEFPDGNLGVSASRNIVVDGEGNLWSQLLNNTLRSSGYQGAFAAISQIVDNFSEIVSGIGTSQNAFADFGQGVDLNDDYVNVLRRTFTTDLPSVLFGFKRDLDVQGATGIAGNIFEGIFDTLNIADDAAQTAGSLVNNPGAWLANAIRGQSGIGDIFTGGAVSGTVSNLNIAIQGTPGRHGGFGGVLSGINVDYDINDSLATQGDYWNVNLAESLGEELLELISANDGNRPYNKDFVRSRVQRKLNKINESISDISANLGVSESAARKTLVSSYQGIVADINSNEDGTTEESNIIDRLGTDDPYELRRLFTTQKPFSFDYDFYSEGVSASPYREVRRQHINDYTGSDIAPLANKLKVGNFDIDLSGTAGAWQHPAAHGILYYFTPETIGDGSIPFSASFNFTADTSGNLDDSSLERIQKMTAFVPYSGSGIDAYNVNLWAQTSINTERVSDPDSDLDPHLIENHSVRRLPTQDFPGEGKDIFYDSFRITSDGAQRLFKFDELQITRNDADISDASLRITSVEPDDDQEKTSIISHVLYPQGKSVNLRGVTQLEEIMYNIPSADYTVPTGRYQVNRSLETLSGKDRIFVNLALDGEGNRDDDYKIYNYFETVNVANLTQDAEETDPNNVRNIFRMENLYRDSGTKLDFETSGALFNFSPPDNVLFNNLHFNSGIRVEYSGNNIDGETGNIIDPHKQAAFSISNPIQRNADGSASSSPSKYGRDVFYQHIHDETDDNGYFVNYSWSQYNHTEDVNNLFSIETDARTSDEPLGDEVNNYIYSIRNLTSGGEIDTSIRDFYKSLRYSDINIRYVDGRTDPHTSALAKPTEEQPTITVNRFTNDEQTDTKAIGKDVFYDYAKNKYQGEFYSWTQNNLSTDNNNIFSRGIVYANADEKFQTIAFSNNDFIGDGTGLIDQIITSNSTPETTTERRSTGKSAYYAYKTQTSGDDTAAETMYNFGALGVPGINEENNVNVTSEIRITNLPAEVLSTEINDFYTSLMNNNTSQSGVQEDPHFTVFNNSTITTARQGKEVFLDTFISGENGNVFSWAQPRSAVNNDSAKYFDILNSVDGTSVMQNEVALSGENYFNASSPQDGFNTVRFKYRSKLRGDDTISNPEVESFNQFRFYDQPGGTPISTINGVGANNDFGGIPVEYSNSNVGTDSILSKVPLAPDQTRFIQQDDGRRPSSWEPITFVPENQMPSGGENLRSFTYNMSNDPAQSRINGLAIDIVQDAGSFVDSDLGIVRTTGEQSFDRLDDRGLLRTRKLEVMPSMHYDQEFITYEPGTGIISNKTVNDSTLRMNAESGDDDTTTRNQFESSLSYRGLADDQEILGLESKASFYAKIALKHTHEQQDSMAGAFSGTNYQRYDNGWDKGVGYLLVRRNANPSDSENIVRRIPMQFNPEITGESRSANWAQHTAIGRTQEYFIWSNTSARTVQFKTTYAVVAPSDSSPDWFKDDGSNNSIYSSWGSWWTEEQLTAILNQYRSILLPQDYSDLDLTQLNGNRLSPPIIQVIFGTQTQTKFSDSGDDSIYYATWIATDLNIDPRMEAGYTEQRNPRMYDITMTLKEVTPSWRSYQSHAQLGL